LPRLPLVRPPPCVMKKSNNSAAHDRSGQKDCFSKNVKIALELRIKPNDIVTARNKNPTGAPTRILLFLSVNHRRLLSAILFPCYILS
jgi:hypothetical protein